MIADKTEPHHLSRKQMRRIIDRYRVTSGKGFRLKDHDPTDTAGHLLAKPQADAMVARDVHRLAELQEKLYAQNSWAMLCVLQAMDAAGKDSTIKLVIAVYRLIPPVKTRLSPFSHLSIHVYVMMLPVA